MSMNTNFPRRTVLKGLGAAMVAPLAMPAIAQPRRRLVVQAPGGVYEETLRSKIIPDFEAKHGYEVVFVAGSSPTIIPKILASRSNPPFDVVTINNDISFIGQEADLWETGIADRLPLLDRIYPSMKPPETGMYGLMYYEYPLVYNTSTMDAPTRWMDLWEKDITVAVPNLAASYGMTFLYIAALLHGGDAENLDPGFEAIKRLPRYKIYNNVTQGLNLFQQGEADAGLFYGHRAQQMMNSGLPIAKVRPSEGIWGQRTGAQIPRNASNLEGAIEWINMALDVPYQTELAQFLYAPTNMDVVLTGDAAEQNLMGAELAATVQEAPWQIILPQRDVLLDRWTREIRS
ncbi:MAG: extracellular solute-binding protein [Salinarimonas sp.]